ncbi:MAG: hypothetical protein JRI39_11205, partial [Deltaproteobacteria bacterium]|nr:hypothetical protein [Deltaproteobacteria bacterium]
MRRYWGVCSISLFLLLLLLGGARNAMALTGGPDRYGYTYSDSEEPGAAPFSWIDISKTGT